MKKRWIMAVLVLVAVLTFSCAWAEQASVTTYHITDMGISVDLDSDISVYMAGDQEISEAYTGIGITKEYMDNLMAENMLSLHALINKGSRELTLICVPVALDDFDKQSEESLDAIRINTENQFTTIGAEIKDSAYVDTGVGKALCIHYSYKSGLYSNYMTQYSLLRDQRMVNLRMSSNTGWLNMEEEAWLLKVADTLKWEEYSVPEVVQPDGNTAYHVESAKLSLELPSALPVYCYGDTDVNNQYKARGLTREYMDQLMEGNNMCLHALVNNTGELIIIASPLEGVVPEDVTEEERETMLEMMKVELESAGATMTTNEIVDTVPGRAFHCVFDVVAGGIAQKCEQYTLFGNGSIVVVRISNYTGGLTGEEQAMLLDAVNSITWDD